MIKRPKRYWLTYVWTGPWDVLIWIVVLFIWVLWGQRLQWVEGLWCELKEKSWPARTWFKKWGAATLGHGGFGKADCLGEMGIIDTKLEFHEHVHVEQYEAAMLLGFMIMCFLGVWSVIVGGGVPWWVYLACWLFMGSLSYLASVIQAFIRGEPPYRGSHLEEAARAVATQYYKQKNGIE